MNTKIPEISISFRAGIDYDSTHSLRDSNCVAEYLRKIWDRDTIELREEFKVIYLNRANYPIGFLSLSNGTLTGCLVDIRLVIATALKCMATGIIVAHNHPSGNLVFSSDDRNVTKKIMQAASFFDITLLDSLILGPQGHVSLADIGLLSNLEREER